MIKLRSYQQRCFDSVMNYFSKGGQKPFIHLFTGGGKAYLGLKIGLEVCDYATSTMPGRVAFLAHTKELTDQPYQSLQTLMPNLKTKYYGKLPAMGIVRANRNQPNARFLFATMQTLAREEGKRLDEVLSHGAFDLVIVDEAHHSAAKSYSATILPKLLEANPDTKILGMSATPARSDGKALDGYFDDLVFSMSLLEGINGGWLKTLTARQVQTEVSLGDIARYNDDFEEKALRNALRVQNWTDIVGRAYMENDGPERSCIAFMPSVEMGHELGNWFREQGIRAASVAHDSIQDAEGNVFSGNGNYWKARERVLDEFRQQQLQVLIGFSVLLEGFDARCADMILQGRPTESSVLLTQLIGRGVRTPEGIARLLQDREKEKYVIQRDGDDDHWYEYAYDKLPFNPDCLVLDFTLKDTNVLLTGSLAGEKVETPDVKEIEEEETLQIFEVEPLPSEFELILKSGEAIKYFKRNFFKLSTVNCTMGLDASMSMYLGAVGEGNKKIGSALFLYPRRPIMVSRMNEVLQILDYVDQLDINITQDQVSQFMSETMAYQKAFDSFLMFQITDIPVDAKKKNNYDSEWKRWDSSQLKVKWVGRYPDHTAAWESALILSQQLATGGFFVDKNRPGARNKATQAQSNLLYNETYKNGAPNMFYTLPVQANALLNMPGLEVFQIEKPSMRSMVDATSLEISAQLNHIGIYSAVMKQLLAARIVNAQKLYTIWTTLWQQRKT